MTPYHITCPFRAYSSRVLVYSSMCATLPWSVSKNPVSSGSHPARPAPAGRPLADFLSPQRTLFCTCLLMESHSVWSLVSSFVPSRDVLKGHAWCCVCEDVIAFYQQNVFNISEMQIISPKHKTVPLPSLPASPKVPHCSHASSPETRTEREPASQRQQHITGQEGQEGPAQRPG